MGCDEVQRNDRGGPGKRGRERHEVALANAERHGENVHERCGHSRRYQHRYGALRQTTLNRRHYREGDGACCERRLDGNEPSDRQALQVFIGLEGEAEGHGAEPHQRKHEEAQSRCRPAPSDQRVQVGDQQRRQCKHCHEEATCEVRREGCVVDEAGEHSQGQDHPAEELHGAGHVVRLLSAQNP